MSSLFATADASAGAERRAFRDTRRAFCDKAAPSRGAHRALREDGLAFHDTSCVSTCRAPHFSRRGPRFLRQGRPFEGRGWRFEGRCCHVQQQRCRWRWERCPCAGWRMGKKASKCYKNGHARCGWRHLRHAKEQKRPAQGEQRNKQGEARCATGTGGMGVGWRPDRSGHWRCVLGVLKRRSLRLPCRLAQWRQALTRPRCAMSLGLGQHLPDQHIRINPVRPHDHA